MECNRFQSGISLVRRQVDRAAILPVTEDGVISRRCLDPDLMHPPGLQMNLQPRLVLPALNDAVIEHSMTSVGVRLGHDLSLRLIRDLANKVAPDTDVRLDATLDHGPIDLSNHPGFKLFGDPSRGPAVPGKQDCSRDGTVKTMWDTQINSGPRLFAICQEIAEHFDQRRYTRWRLNKDPWWFVNHQTFLALVEDLGCSARKTQPALILRRHHFIQQKATPRHE